MLAATTLAGIGYILFAFVHSYTTFLIVYLGVISFAFTAGFVHAPTVVANSWFIRLRARAMTVVSAAVPIGGALITPLLAIAVRNLGWRPAAFLAGTLFLVGGVPFCLGIKRSPESIGMQPDGMPIPSENRAIKPGERIASNKIDPEISGPPSVSLGDFLEFGLRHDLPLGGVYHLTTHFIPMMVWKGLSQTEASVLLAGFAILNLPIHFLLGWIADFVNKPKLVTICLFLGVVAVIPMLFSNSLWALWFFAGLYTVLDASIPVYWAAVGDFFGRKSFGTIRGNMNLFYTWGSVLGPVLAGYVYDRTQSYAWCSAA